LANPSGLLQGAILMLNHLGETAVAEKVQNAWLKTIEEGTHTYDIFKEGTSKRKVGTKEFADAVIENLGQIPTILSPVNYAQGGALVLPKYVRRTPAKKELVGVDVFIDLSSKNPDKVASLIQKIEEDCAVTLTMITNRGIKVWPEGFEETFCTDHWRCRFKPVAGSKMTKSLIAQVLLKADTLKIDTIKTENLYEFDGVAGYSLGQGQ
jgi:isocitrate dehydrogenase